MEVNNELNWECIGSYPIENRVNFWKSILLSVIKPHLINRRLAGAQQISVFQSHANDLNIETNFIEQIAHTIQQPFDDDIDAQFMKKIIQNTQNVDKFHEIDVHCLSECDLNEEKQILVVLSKLLPKNLASNKCTFEVAILDSKNNQAAFFNLLKNQTTGFLKRFLIQMIESKTASNNNMSVIAPNADDENCLRQTNWIKEIFIPKISKWIVSMDENYVDKSKTGFDSIDSLTLINLPEYNQLYNDLKVKYGENMVKIWPEQTDPSKYVYEDVAIATYLILVWREERRRLNIDHLQSFVDLGCGNGLLVYILSSEGHRGYGIDVRKRGIWDLYPSTTVLKAEAIIPSDRSLFPDIDWIIGNHSDELSPWIPVISARSSYKSRYFLLPCCAFEFSGKKFQRRCSAVSQYMDFLSYVQQISDVCGFKTQIDRLKIPSTKRICLIGYDRTYPSDEQSKRDDQIQEFINTTSNDPSEPKNHVNNWNNEFQPRANVEKIQNCTTVDKTIQNEIIDRVFGELIKKKRYLSDQYKTNWNAGGKISLSDLAKLIPNDQLKALKSECGGLQTLLKNHSQVFRVANGVVEIKVPIKWSDKKRELEAKGIEIQLKHKLCWFHSNHPDGCPLTDDDCSFVH